MKLWYNKHMKRINIKEVDYLNEILAQVKSHQPMIIQEGKEEKFAIITMEDYEEFMQLYHADLQRNPLKYGKPKEIHIMTEPNESFDMSEEEYEDIKRQLLDAIEKTFKPKTNKMN